jgi:hypothetical protein
MKKNGMRPIPPVKFSTRNFWNPWADGQRAREGDRGAGQSDTAILKDQRGIRGDTAIRLGTFFKTSYKEKRR